MKGPWTRLIIGKNFISILDWEIVDIDVIRINYVEKEERRQKSHNTVDVNLS